MAARIGKVAVLAAPRAVEAATVWWGRRGGAHGGQSGGGGESGEVGDAGGEDGGVIMASSVGLVAMAVQADVVAQMEALGGPIGGKGQVGWW